MAITEQEIVAFVLEFTASKPAQLNSSDVFGSLTIDGDDVDEFLEEYAKRFEVDISSFIWYFHSGSEGWNLAWLVFKPPWRQVQEIPITIEMLTRFANERRWGIAYPAHQLSPPYDVWFSPPITAIFVAILGVSVALIMSGIEMLLDK